jgi:hypothetical protein
MVMSKQVQNKKYTEHGMDVLNVHTRFCQIIEIYIFEFLPSILQWKTEVSVTKAKVFREIHFQNMTSSVIV